MEFTNLQEAIVYAQQNNMDVQKQGDKWVPISKPVISIERIIEDTERALAEEKSKEEPDTELISQLEMDLQELKQD